MPKTGGEPFRGWFGRVWCVGRFLPSSSYYLALIQAVRPSIAQQVFLSNLKVYSLQQQWAIRPPLAISSTSCHFIHLSTSSQEISHGRVPIVLGKAAGMR